MDDVQPYLVEKLEHIRLRYERLLTDKLPAWDGHEIGAPDFAKYIWFKKGWYEVESRGVWSENKVSVFSFKLPSKRYNSIFLNFSGVYFGEEEKTKILVNGEKIAEKPLVNTVIRIPEKLLKTPIITISLIHEEPVSPEELGQGKGNRKIKYGLTRLSWKVI
jgi:hypothetical protein